MVDCMNRVTGDTSKVISFLRFPLIVMVVFIHSKLKSENGNLQIYDYIEYGISDIICRIAVPLFYFISGYLFFINTDFTFKNYYKKLKIRVRTILIPYLVWNLIVLLVFLIVDLYFPAFRTPTSKQILQYNFVDIICAFWDTNIIYHIEGVGEPICFQFWFLRDLMISMLLIPIITIVNKNKWVDATLLLILLVLWFIGIDIPLSGFSIVSFVFFYAGLSAMKWDIIPIRKISTCIFLIPLCYLGIFIIEEIVRSEFLQKISILIGMVTLWLLVKDKIKKHFWKPNKFLSDSSFFLYAAHGIILTFLVKLSSRLYGDYELVCILLFFLNPLITITLCLLIYKILRSKFPFLEKLLTGNR